MVNETWRCQSPAASVAHVRGQHIYEVPAGDQQSHSHAAHIHAHTHMLYACTQTDWGSQPQ